jgi:hypothetical protein
MSSKQSSMQKRIDLLHGAQVSILAKLHYPNLVCFAKWNFQANQKKILETFYHSNFGPMSKISSII